MVSPSSQTLSLLEQLPTAPCSVHPEPLHPSSHFLTAELDSLHHRGWGNTKLNSLLELDQAFPTLLQAPSSPSPVGSLLHPGLCLSQDFFSLPSPCPLPTMRVISPVSTNHTPAAHGGFLWVCPESIFGQEDGNKPSQGVGQPERCECRKSLGCTP